MSILNDIDRMDQLIGQTNNETSKQFSLSNDDIDSIFTSLDNEKQTIKPAQSSNAPDFIPGIKRGVQNLQASSYGALGLTGAGLKRLGFEETGQKLQNVGFEGYRRNIKEAEQTPAKYSFKDVYTGKAGLGGTIDWTQGVLGELVPSMTEAAVGAAVGSLAAPGPGTAVGGFTGRTILKKSIDQAVKGLVKEGTEKAVEDQIRKQVTKQALKKLGGKVGMGAAVFPMESGSMYGDLFESHGVDAPETAMLFGALSTALEYAGGNSKLVDTFVDAMAKGSKGTAKQSAKEILRNIPQEAIQEGGQEVAAILNTVINTDEKLLTLDNLERIVESMAAGAVGGGAGAGVQFGMEGKNFNKPSKLDTQVDNIKSGGIENIQAALTDLDAKDNFANSLLNNPEELQAQAKQFGMTVEELSNNIGSQIMANNQLRERLKVELAKPAEEIKQTTEPVDVNAKLDELRKQQEAKQQQINLLNNQADKLRKEFYKSTDETVKADLKNQIVTLLTQRNALINKGKQGTVKPGVYEEPKKADEILAERQKVWQDNWVDESTDERRPEIADKSAKESASVIYPYIDQLDNQLNQLYQQIDTETNNEKRNQLQREYEELFGKRNSIINTFEENDQAKFDAIVNQVETDRSQLTNEQQTVVNANTAQIKQLTAKLNSTIDRAERISLLNQIDELSKINEGIRTPIENVSQLGEANIATDITNAQVNDQVDAFDEVDYEHMSDTDLAKSINDFKINQVINQAHQSIAEARQQNSTDRSSDEQTVSKVEIGPNTVDVSPYTNFNENEGTPEYIISKSKTPYKNKTILEQKIKALPNYNNYLIVKVADGFIGVRKDISDNAANQFQNIQRANKQSIKPSFNIAPAEDITPTDITPTDIDAKNIINYQFKTAENVFSPADVNSNQFKSWFTGSSVTDENNAPLKVYHGSKTFGIDQDTQWIFNNDRGTRGTQSPMAGLGFFFATDRNEAQGYAGSGNGTIHSVYLNIKNPLIVNSYEIPQFSSREEAQAFAKRMELAGFDGIHIQDEGHYIAFKPEQIKSADLNTGGFDASNPDIRFQTNENNQLTKQVSIDDIKAAFPNQQINKAEDGTISVGFKNGRGLIIKNIQAAENNFVKYAIETGQMSKNGKILGMTVGNEILLDENFADNATLWHENKHVLDNLGMITEADNAMLNAEFNRLRKLGKLNFAISTHEDSVQRMVENRANMFAQIMVDRTAYRDKPLGKVIQRIMDFFQQLFVFGKQTVAGLAREVESGKIYSRKVGNQTYQTIVPQNEVAAKQWYSALENAVASVSVKQALADQWKGMPLFKTKELIDEIKKNGFSGKVYRGFAKGFEFRGDGSPMFFSPNKSVKGYAHMSEHLGEPLIGKYQVTIKKPKIYIGQKDSGKATFSTGKEQVKELKSQGYDGAIHIIDGKIKDVIAFNSSQVSNLIYGSARGDVNFEVREMPEQKLTDEEYAKMFQQKKSVWKLYQQASKINWQSTKLLADKLFTPISTRLKEANLKFVSDELRKLDFRTSKNIIDVLQTAKPILDIANGKKNAPVKMTEQDRNLWNLARLQADTAVVQRLAEKYGMKDQVEKLRAKLDQIRTDAIDVGLDVGFIDEYWPRVLKDQAGFLQKFYEDKEFSQRPIFTEALNQKAKDMGITRAELESYPDVKADVISNVILGRPTGLGGPGNIRSRKFDTIPSEYIEFYMDADASLMQYVYSMTKKIEARRFFGAIPENIRKAKTDKTSKLKELTKLEDFLKQGQFDDGTNPEIIQTKITQLKEDISLLDDKLDKYKYSERDYSESIGAYIARLMVEGKLHRKDEQTVKDILSARFNDRGTHGVVNTFKNAAYIDVMGNPMSALTQIGDLAWAMYVGKVWTPKGFSNTINNLINAAFNKSKITKEDIGIERIAQEFADGTTLGNAVSNVFKIVGLTKIDSIGKETLINNALNNYQARARSADQNVVKQLRQELRSIFGNETEALIRELSIDKTGNEKYSDNVKYLLYSRLLDFQPAALSEMPEMYLHGGNARVFYMLKTYTLKQLDVFRNEVFHKIKHGNVNEKLEGITNMIKLGALLTLANAGADELKDLLLGKETKFQDHVVENLLTMGGASRFVQMQVTREGIGSAAMQQILPPMKFVNSLSKDLMQSYTDYVAGDAMSVADARIVESLPVIGKLAYWHVGRGTEYKKSIPEQDFKKAGSEARLFKRKLENAENKRLFLQSNLNDFKKMKIHDNIQTSINNIQQTINKLEKLEQTPNVRKRLGQLEERKEKIFQSYFDHIDQLGLN